MKLLNKIRINKLFNCLHEQNKLFYKFEKQLNEINWENKGFCDEFIKIFIEKIQNNEIKGDKLVQFLTYFLKTQKNDNKIYIFNSILEKIYNNDYFLKTYCFESCYQIPISYKLGTNVLNSLSNTFIKILDESKNKLSHDILILIRQNLENDELVLDEDNKKKLAHIIEKRLKELINLDKLTSEEYIMLNYEAYIKLTEFIWNKEIENIIINLDIDKFTSEIKIQLIRIMIFRKLKVPKKTINDMFQKIDTSVALLSWLEYLNAKELIPKNVKITQEEIATYQMIEWLCFPSELGCEPKEIKIIDKLEKGDYCYYVFSFKSPMDTSKSFLAVSRGYKMGELTTLGIGSDFSDFEEISENYHEQVDKIFKILEDWENN